MPGRHLSQRRTVFFAILFFAVLAVAFFFAFFDEGFAKVLSESHGHALSAHWHPVDIAHAITPWHCAIHGMSIDGGHTLT